MRLKIRRSHLTCKVENKCLNIYECEEVVERNKNKPLLSTAVVKENTDRQKENRFIIN